MPEARWKYMTKIAPNKEYLSELIRKNADNCWELVQVIPPNSLDNYYVVIFKMERSTHRAIYG